MKKKELLASESFPSSAKRHYFVDMKRAANDSRYIQLTRSELQEDGSYKRWPFVIFENDFEDFIASFSSLFHTAAYQGAGYQTVLDLANEQVSAKGIKAMPEELRPREKMMECGANELSDVELLAILLGSGSVGETAIGLAARIIDGNGGNLCELKGCDFPSLCRFKGMGMAKAASVMAAMELARRVYTSARTEVKTVYLVRRPGEDDENQFLFKSN